MHEKSRCGKTMRAMLLATWHAILAEVRYDLPLRPALMHLHQRFHTTAVGRCPPHSTSHRNNRSVGRSQTSRFSINLEAMSASLVLFDSALLQVSLPPRRYPPSATLIASFGASYLLGTLKNHMAAHQDHVNSFGAKWLHLLYFLLGPITKITNVT